MYALERDPSTNWDPNQPGNESYITGTRSTSVDRISARTVLVPRRPERVSFSRRQQRDVKVAATCGPYVTNVIAA